MTPAHSYARSITVSIRGFSLRFCQAIPFVLLLLPSVSIYGDAASATNNAELATSGASISSLFFDAEDGMLDLSGYLATAKGFLPTGSLITEPAIGYGGALGLAFLHDSIQNRAELAKKRNPDGSLKKLPPPSVTALGGFGTGNGSWGSGLAHLHVSEENRFRYLGALFYADMNLEYYGKGGDLNWPTEYISYTLDGTFLVQQLSYRLGESDFWLGGNYQYMSFDTALDLGLGTPPPPWFPSLERSIASAGVSIFAEYDTRNTIFTPDSGINAKLSNTSYARAVGSDNDFNKASLKLRYWKPIQPSLVLGLRGDANFSGGNIPFYMLPSIDLRGISISRYQGQHTITTEAELRWDMTPRWSLVGFGGVGWAADSSLDDFEISDHHLAGGTGFRYLISKVFGIRSGMDFAWSEEDFAFYFVTGTAWR